MTSTRAHRLWCNGLPVLLVLLGAVIRARQWCGARSFWIDELAIHASVRSRGFGALASEPLLLGQSAPVGWLWSHRLSYVLLGGGERAQRLPELLAGIGALVVVLLLARAVLPAAVVPVAVAVVALSPPLIRYSNELKPYGTDAALVATALLLVARAAATSSGRRHIVQLAAFGAVAVWWSNPVVFVLAAGSTVLVVRALVGGRLREGLVIAGVLSGWVVSLAVAYVTVLSRSRNSSVLNTYWAFTFPKGKPLGSWATARWTALLDFPLDLSGGLRLAGALLLIGAVALAVRGRSTGASAVLAVALGTGAAAAAVYPLADRLALWLVPIAALCLAALFPAGGRLRLPLRAAWLGAATTLTLFVTGAGAGHALASLPRRDEIEETRDLLTTLRSELQPGDAVVGTSSGIIGLDFYATRTGTPDDGLLMPARRVGPTCQDSADLRAVGFASGRVWVVNRIGSGETFPAGPFRALEPSIQTVAHPIRRIDRPGMYAVLFVPGAPAKPVQGKLCVRYFPGDAATRATSSSD